MSHGSSCVVAGGVVGGGCGRRCRVLHVMHRLPRGRQAAHDHSWQLVQTRRRLWGWVVGSDGMGLQKGPGRRDILRRRGCCGSAHSATGRKAGTSSGRCGGGRERRCHTARDLRCRVGAEIVLGGPASALGRRRGAAGAVVGSPSAAWPRAEVLRFRERGDGSCGWCFLPCGWSLASPPVVGGPKGLCPLWPPDAVIIHASPPSAYIGIDLEVHEMTEV
eukprot:48549-Eustigmatos_ZCMA.PRE.1